MTYVTTSQLRAWNERYRDSSASEILRFAAATFPNLTVASSFGAEDCVLIALLHGAGLKVRTFFLDTGRLHQETYETVDRVRRRYDWKVEFYYPNGDALQSLVGRIGPNGFYDSVENRRDCCHVRKVEPLTRALKESDAWITGMRKEQAVTRENLDVFALDDAGRVKVNPLTNWSSDQLWDFIKQQYVPVNPMHRKGFVSIGCAPCTRPVAANESPRAGRWWWEDESQKECGLHVDKPKAQPVHTVTSWTNSVAQEVGL